MKLSIVYGQIFMLVTVSGMVNLFITKTEMLRTLGISAELNYIENGIVNGYSTKFPYRVETNVSKVMFSWNTQVMDREIYYTLRAVSNDVAVLPVLRIAKTGVVPIETETFTVEYRCAGNKAGQFEIALHVNFTWPSETNQTNVMLKQQKLCAARLFGRSGSMDDYDFNSYRLDADDDDGQLTANKLFYLAIGCILAVLLIIGSLIFVYFKSKRKSIIDDHEECRHNNGLRNQVPSAQRYPSAIHSSPGYVSQTRPFLRAPVSSVATSSRWSALRGGAVQRPPSLAAPSVASTASASSAPIVFERPRKVDVKAAVAELAVDRNLFQMMPFVELEGTFGEMRWAIWRQTAQMQSGDIDIEEDEAMEDVAVLAKTLKANADRRHYEKFMAEALVFHRVPAHVNLAQITAAASYNPAAMASDTIGDYPLLCYRHQGFGCLKRFLQRCRGGEELLNMRSLRCGTVMTSTPTSSGSTLRAHELVSMSKQIVRALIHLHRFGIVHKDVATRNCIVAEIPSTSTQDRLLVQLTDNALSRDLFSGDYHCLGDNENRPVKWMAIESLENGEYSSASDVWSFGVTLWELLSCGQQPYAEIDPEEMLAHLKDSTRLAQPYNCPDELFGVMFCCWHQNYQSRPACDQLLLALEDFTKQLQEFI